MKAVVYCRYSSDAQRAASLADQERNCRKRAQTEGWTVTTVYGDAAISGTSAARPQYQQMLLAAGRQEFDVLVVDDLSRLARDQVETERAIRRLEFQGVRVVGLSDGYDSQSKSRKVTRTVRGLVNEIYIDDLRDKTHRGLAGQAAKQYWCGGRVYGFRLRPILDPSQRDQYDQPVRIGTKLEIDPPQATIVREIFRRYLEGQSTRSIAAELNRRKVPSPGSGWKRKTRRCEGWTGSGVRVILLGTTLYRGHVRWNTSQYVKDPDTGTHVRRARDRAEWIEYQDESLRIVSDETFAKAQSRTAERTNSDKRLKTGGRAKFLLSGLLRCKCGAHMVMGDNRAYVCGGHREGACSISTRVRRDALETAILNPLRKDLLSPERVAKMAREIQREYVEHVTAMQKRAVEAPKELVALDARIARLRERQRTGDPDLTSEELQTVIDRALAERKKLDAAQPAAKDSAKLLAMLPNVAQLYRRQVEAGLDGDPRATLKARTALRNLCGPIRVECEKDGSVWAAYDMQPAALVSAAVTAAVSGGGRCPPLTVPVFPQRVRVK